MQKSQSIIEVLRPDPPFWTKTAWLQLGYGIWVNMTVMGIGLSFGFPAVAIPQLKEDPSSFKMTLSDEAWIVSILTLSSPIGSLICGILMDKYGRKLVLVLCEIPMCFGWFYTGFAVTARDMIIGRVIVGVGLGMAFTAPRTYITEITLPNMRGVIGALPNLFISLGITLQAGLGPFLKWYILCYISGCYTFITMIANIFLPDTPYFLLLNATNSSTSIAKLNLRRFRSSKFNVDAEIEALYDFRAENDIRSLTCKEQFKALFKPSACKPYGIATTYIVFMQLAGVNVVIMWAVEILNTAKCSLDSNLGNFALAITRIVFGVLTSLLLYKVGRRPLALVSAIGVGLLAIGFWLFLYLYDEESIYPQIIFMAYIAFATVGYYTLPFLMMFELLPLQLRGLLSGICISQLNILMFGMNKCYPFLRDSIGLGNTMAMFGGFSLLGAFILYFILPETKGLTLQEIEEFFNARRPTLVSQRHVISDQLFDTSRMNVRQSKSDSFIIRHSAKGNKSKAKLVNVKDKDTKMRDRVESDFKNKEKYLQEKKKTDDKNEVDSTVDKKESKVLMDEDKDLIDFVRDLKLPKEYYENEEKSKDLKYSESDLTRVNKELKVKNSKDEAKGFMIKEEDSRIYEPDFRVKEKDSKDKVKGILIKEDSKNNEEHLKVKEKDSKDKPKGILIKEDSKDKPKGIIIKDDSKTYEEDLRLKEKDSKDNAKDSIIKEKDSKENEMNLKIKEDSKDNDKDLKVTEKDSKDKKELTDTEKDLEDSKSLDSEDSKDSIDGDTKKHRKKDTPVKFKDIDDGV